MNQMEERNQHSHHSHKRRHGSVYEHIRNLRIEYVCCMLMILLILALQVYDWLLLPQNWNEAGVRFGSERDAFRISTVTCFPFFLIPCTVLAVCDQILKNFFARNGSEMSERVPRFDRHPHTRYQKAFTRLFIAITLFLSVVSCTGASIQHGIFEPWIGLISSAFVMAFLWKCARRLRRCKREYLRQRARRTTVVETVDEEDETTDDQGE